MGRKVCLVSAEPLAIEMRGIVKRFPGVLANDHISLQVRQGKIHALLGENGAGKSTLMNILVGLYRPDTGEVYINGTAVHFSSPRDAIQHGLGMVHQHFMLVPTKTVAENMILGQRKPRFLINHREIEEEIADLSKQYGLAVDPRAYIWQLSVGEQQRVEVLKMLYQGAKILILDEPTAVLTPQEVEALFATLKNMVRSDHIVIFISHKLDEVIAIADRVTVLRRGKVVDSIEIADTSKADLARRMVGREVIFRIDKKPADPTDVTISVKGVSCENDRGLPALRNLSLSVRSGEILGLAGVAGNGQTELAEVINGLRPTTQGKVTICGKDLTDQPPALIIDAGVAYIPADRTGVGSAPGLSCSDNLIIKSYRNPPISNRWSLNKQKIRENAEQLIEKFDVQTPDVDTPSRMLSGGNLQKLILAREFSQDPNVIVAIYPSRGLDVGATENVHRLLIEERDQGSAILLISEDLDELLSLTDRLAVIYEGEIVGEVPPEDERVEEIGLLMAGAKLDVDHAH